MKKIFTILLFASSIWCNAQWIHSGPEYYHHISKPFLIHGNELWTKSNSTILRSLDNGNNWSTICNIPISVNDLLVTNNYAIAISNQGIYKSSNNYTDWQLTSAIISSIIRETITGRIILGSGPYYSDDNGMTWTQSNVASVLELRDIVEYNGKLIGAGQNGVYISDDNGINWSPSNQGISALDLMQTVWNICIFDNKIFISTGSSTGYYKSSDLGQTWVQAYTGLLSNSIINPNIVVINNQLLTTNSNGSYIYNLATNDWQLSTINQSTLVGINNYHDNKYWGLKKEFDGFVKTSDNGLTWQNSFTGIKQADCRRLSVSKGNLYSIGNHGSFAYDKKRT